MDRVACSARLQRKRVCVFACCPGRCFVLILLKVQLNVNVETTIVSQIDDEKDHIDLEASLSTPTLAAIDEEGNYKVLDRDSSDIEDEKYHHIA